MKNTGDDGVFVHTPFFENFLDGQGVNDVRFAAFSKLAGMSFGGKLDGLINFSTHIIYD